MNLKKIICAVVTWMMIHTAYISYGASINETSIGADYITIQCSRDITNPSQLNCGHVIAEQITGAVKSNNEPTRSDYYKYDDYAIQSKITIQIDTLWIIDNLSKLDSNEIDEQLRKYLGKIIFAKNAINSDEVTIEVVGTNATKEQKNEAVNILNKSSVLITDIILGLDPQQKIKYCISGYEKEFCANNGSPINSQDVTIGAIENEPDNQFFSTTLYNLVIAKQTLKNIQNISGFDRLTKNIKDKIFCMPLYYKMSFNPNNDVQFKTKQSGFIAGIQKYSDILGISVAVGYSQGNTHFVLPTKKNNIVSTKNENFFANAELNYECTDHFSLYYKTGLNFSQNKQKDNTIGDIQDYNKCVYYSNEIGIGYVMYAKKYELGINNGLKLDYIHQGAHTDIRSETRSINFDTVNMHMCTYNINIAANVHNFLLFDDAKISFDTDIELNRSKNAQQIYQYENNTIQKKYSGYFDQLSKKFFSINISLRKKINNNDITLNYSHNWTKNFKNDFFSTNFVHNF